MSPTPPLPGTQPSWLPTQKKGKLDWPENDVGWFVWSKSWLGRLIRWDW